MGLEPKTITGFRDYWTQVIRLLNCCQQGGNRSVPPSVTSGLRFTGRGIHQNLGKDDEIL